MTEFLGKVTLFVIIFSVLYFTLYGVFSFIEDCHDKMKKKIIRELTTPETEERTK